MVLLLTNQAEARFFVNVSGCTQHAIGPQGYLLVARLTRETYALRYETFANAQAARFWFNQQ